MLAIQSVCETIPTFAMFAARLTFDLGSVVRPAKLEAVRAKLQGRADVVPVEDVVIGDFTEALKGEQVAPSKGLH